jgi:hypothetical protein
MDQLLQLVPMFDDTKQFLRKVETVDSSQPKLEAEGLSKQGGGSARQQLLQLVPMFDETKQFLRKVETVDSSQPKLEAEGLSPRPQSASSPRQQLLQLVPLFDETKQYLRRTPEQPVTPTQTHGSAAAPVAPTPRRAQVAVAEKQLAESQRWLEDARQKMLAMQAEVRGSLQQDVESFLAYAPIAEEADVSRRTILAPNLKSPQLWGTGRPPG